MIHLLADAGDVWSRLFDFSDYGALVALLRNSIIAGAVLGVVGGLIGVFVMTRDLAFAVHGVSELSFAGAAAALLLGVNVVGGSLVGSLIAAIAIGVLGTRAKDRNSIIAVIMPFGLGLGILFLALYDGRASNKFGLLTCEIVSVDNPQLGYLVAISAVVIVGLAVVWRPLMFASVDPDVAAARGVPVRLLSIVFMILLGLGTAVSIQIVGALLVLSLLVTPAAAAMRARRRRAWSSRSACCSRSRASWAGSCWRSAAASPSARTSRPSRSRSTWSAAASTPSARAAARRVGRVP